MTVGEKGSHPQGASASLGVLIAGDSLLNVWWLAMSSNIA
jgi:hypothetical protein